MTAPDDIAIGDTFARPEAPSEAWEVTQIGDIETRARRCALYMLTCGERMRFATVAVLRDARMWHRVRAL
jgi:hypothetical protein